MFLHNPFDDGKANPAPFVIGVELLKDLSEFVGVLHVEADALVPDVVDRFPPLSSHPISIRGRDWDRVYFNALKMQLEKT